MVLTNRRPFLADRRVPQPTTSSWARYHLNPIIPVGGNATYASQIFDPVVLVNPVDTAQLLMYATGMASPVESGEMSILRFTAAVSDPYIWTYTDQVLVKGGGGTWDANHVRVGCVLYSGGAFYLYYTGRNNLLGDNIGLATSADGIAFTKSVSNPVLTEDGQGRDDGSLAVFTHVGEPAVLKEGTAWTMIYDYNSATTTLPGYRYATSSDGVTWAKGGAGDILTLDPLYAEWHQIIKVNGVYHLIYENGNTTNNFRLNKATASVVTGPYTDDPSPGPTILDKGSYPGYWDRYHVATGYAVLIRNSWYLFYSGAGNHDQPYGTNKWPLGVAVLNGSQITPFLNDSFTDSAGTNLSAHTGETGATWTKQGTGDIILTNTNAVRSGDTSVASYTPSGTPMGADYWVAADVKLVTLHDTLVVAIKGRWTDASNNYTAQVVNDAGGFTIQGYKTVGGVDTQLGSNYDVSALWLAGETHTIKLEMVGTAIKIYLDDTVVISQTDSGLSAAGKPALVLYTTVSPGNAAGFHVAAMDAQDR